MRCALSPRSHLAEIRSRQGSHSLRRPRWNGARSGGALGDESPACDVGSEAAEPEGALAGFDSASDTAEPEGALAGFEASLRRLRYRATVSRLNPSSLAIRRWDRPWRCRETIRSIMATLSRFDMTRLR